MPRPPCWWDCPFDSRDYVFEVKWDGVRALAAVDKSGWRLWGRELVDYGGRYPELEVLRGLPPGTIVDGELVVFQENRPSLNAILRRHQLAHPAQVRHASRQTPVHYVLFDILNYRGKPLLKEPLTYRRSLLANVLTEINAPELVFSEGVNEFGKAFFEQVVAKDHEGVMAKHRSSRYLPGMRSSAWKKIKPTQVLPCVIIGYTLGGEGVQSTKQPDAARLAKEEADKAMTWLTKVVAADWPGPDVTNVGPDAYLEILRKDAQLDFLRDREDFKMLIAEFEKKAKKK